MTTLAKPALFFSIAANAVLLTALAAGYVSIGKARGGGAHVASGGGAGAAGGALSPEAAKAAVAMLETDDMAALRDKLRALGLPEARVRAIVAARIKSRYAARERELEDAALEAARQRPYWAGRDNEAGCTRGQLQERHAIDRETTNEIRQVLGSADDTSSHAFSLHYSLHYAFLPPDKIARLRDLDRDYYDMRWQITDETADFKMPGDEAKLKLLDEEHQRDWQALMTPEEREAYYLRNSDIAARLQRAFSGFDGTEEEFKAIYALQNAPEEKAEGRKNIDAQIKDMLGDERYADYVRGQRDDYQSLLAAAQRFNLGADTVAQTYQVRDDTANEAKRISDDNSMDAAQKTAAYAALAGQATAQIRASLGDDVGDAYINNALPWLKNLPRGGSVKIGPKGDVSVTPLKQ